VRDVVAHSTASLPSGTRRPSLRRTTPQLGAALLTVLATAGCGGSSKPSVCRDGASRVIARTVGASPKTSASIASNSMPQCDFRTPAVRVSVNVDTAPQAYFRLERTAVEASQQFTAVRTTPPPEDITGIGLDADWFPDRDQFMTTDGRRLITVAVRWPAASMARRRALGEAVGRAYVTPSKGSH
jgi:hypothetical protein